MIEALPQPRVENRLLAGLPPEQYNRLQPHFEVVNLSKSKILYEAGETVRHMYFPNRGMISLLSVNEDGTTIEVGMVGYEGVVGIPAVLKIEKMPYEAMVQLPCDVVRIKGDVIRAEFDRGERLQELLLRYTHVLLTQISQSAVCNRFHTAEKRLCRWLLIARVRAKSNTLLLTQEIIAHMLGTPRTGVTMAALTLQKEGFITYRRGKIIILNPKGLEGYACDCYKVIKNELDNFIND